MNNLSAELARTLMADRQRDIEAARLYRQARLTKPAAKRPEPAGHPAPGLLTRLVPWFGGRVRPA